MRILAAGKPSPMIFSSTAKRMALRFAVLATFLTKGLTVESISFTMLLASLTLDLVGLADEMKRPAAHVDGKMNRSRLGIQGA